jgi:hypothetical protein
LGIDIKTKGLFKDMGWKEWPAWVKGGVLCVVLVIFLGTLNGAFMTSVYGRCEEPLWTTCHVDCPPRSMSACFVNALFSFPFYNEPLMFILSGVQILTWFLIGAGIGWIVGRVKNK